MMQQTELVDFINIINSQERYPTYAEEHQDFPIKFQSAFPDKTRGSYLVTHGPVICRDFLGDVAVSLKYGTKSSIYGFSVDIKNQIENKFRSELSLLLTFPDEKSKKNFELNINPVLTCFKIYLSYSVINSLNIPDNQLIVNFGRNISPVGLSLLTWLFKIAAKPLQDNPHIVRAIERRDLNSFLKLYVESFPGKEASYINRVSLETFILFVPAIIEYSVGSIGFSYLSKKKNQISFVHNCSGFFAQFCDKAYSPDDLILRRIFGTLAKALNISVTYNFTPLSREELLEYVPANWRFSIADRQIMLSPEGEFVFSDPSLWGNKSLEQLNKAVPNSWGAEEILPPPVPVPEDDFEELDTSDESSPTEDEEDW